MGVMSYGYWNGIKVKLLNLYSGVSAGLLMQSAQPHHPFPTILVRLAIHPRAGRRSRH